MKKTVLVCGSWSSTAGYGMHMRLILDALKTIEDKIDLYVMPYRFANTSNTYEGPNLEWYQHLSSKFNQNMLGHFDLSIQVGVPTEWKKFGRKNIGITAGVETLTAPIHWIDPINSVDKVITVSSLPANVLSSLNHEGKTIREKVEYIPFAAKDLSKFSDLKLDIKTPFNFLSINQFAPRKNLEAMITWFVQEFHNDSDVGLVIKLYSQSNSTPDYHECRLRLFEILKQFPNRKCQIYFIHGDMNDSEINYFFNHPNIKAYISTSCGESFGLSVFDAACSGMPVIANDYGGYKDYLYQDKVEKNGKTKLRPFFQKVLCDINPVQPNHYMPGIIEPGMCWAYSKEGDFKAKMREVYKDYGRFKKQANELKAILLDKYDSEKIHKMYIDKLFEGITLEEDNNDIIEVD